MVLLAGLALKNQADRIQLLPQGFCVGFFDGGAAYRGLLHLLDDRFVAVSGLNGQLSGQQVIAAVAFCYFDYFTPVSQFGNIFFENDFHGISPIKSFLSCRKRQQGDIAGPLDGRSQPPLMGRAHAGQAARHDLAALGHELLQHANVFVVDIVDLLDTEPADLLPAEELSAAAAFPAAAAWASVTIAAGRMWTS